MKDRYLFKAKDYSSKWHTGLLVSLDDNVCLIGEYGGAKWICDVKTLCQCTGLKDKNGELVWENDIVDFLEHKEIVKYECGSFGIAFKRIIDWEEIASYIMPITGCENALYACENDNYISLWEIYWNFNDEDGCLYTIEVIGNIFDTPELLERRTLDD